MTANELRLRFVTLLAVVLECFAVTSAVRAAITAKLDAAGTAPSLSAPATPARANIRLTEH